jgi:hypothetical protein
MKTLRVPLALLLLTGSLVLAQAPVLGPGAAEENAGAVLRSPQELEQLVAPIALYPDALIAIILPATTAPADIVLAARHVRDFPNDRSQIEHRAWDESVKSLTNYPDVLKWMDDNLQWTKQVGEAFSVQPSDVMQAVQRLRAQARTAGTLVDTPQQQIIAEPEVIRIVPAQPDVIYVPYYDPEVVFVNRPYYHTGPLLTFGVGVPVGSWLAFECDWHRRAIWIGNRHRHWSGHDWRRPLVSYAPPRSGTTYTRTPEVRQWRPPVAPRSSVTYTRHSPSQIVRPTSLSVTTHSYAPRSGVTDVRRPPAQQTQAVDSLPRTYVPGGHRSGTSSRVQPTPSPTASGVPVTVAPTPTFAPSVVAPPPSQTVTPQPAQRRSGTDWSRERDNRTDTNSRGNRSNVVAPSSSPATANVPVTVAPSATFAPSVVAPPPPQTVTPQPAQRRSGTDWSRERDNRTQSHSRPSGGSVAPVTTAPVAVAPSPQYVQPAANPAPARTYSRQPHAASAPNMAVAPPVPRPSPPAYSPPVSRGHAAPVVTPPAQPAPAPQSAPAAAPAARSDNNGNSGAVHRGRRGDDNRER